MFLLFLFYYYYYLLLLCYFYVIFSFVFALLCIISCVVVSLHLKLFHVTDDFLLYRRFSVILLCFLQSILYF